MSKSKFSKANRNANHAHPHTPVKVKKGISVLLDANLEKAHFSTPKKHGARDRPADAWREYAQSPAKKTETAEAASAPPPLPRKTDAASHPVAAVPPKKHKARVPAPAKKKLPKTPAGDSASVSSSSSSSSSSSGSDSGSSSGSSSGRTPTEDDSSGSDSDDGTVF